MTQAKNDLTTRHEIESKFHDKKYGDGEGYPRHYRLNPTYPIYKRLLVMAGNITGKSIVEYGCGEGWITSDLAALGASVHAFDISEAAVLHTKQSLKAIGLDDRCTVSQMCAERLDYADNSFDSAIGFAILHHLDLELAISELHRILKPGGTAFFAEPLGTNPLINIYRRLTPQYRTQDETPLNLKAMGPMLSRFSAVAHSDYYLTAIAAVALAYVPFGAALYSGANRIMMKVDDALLRRFPKLGCMAWYTILSLTK